MPRSSVANEEQNASIGAGLDYGTASLILALSDGRQGTVIDGPGETPFVPPQLRISDEGIVVGNRAGECTESRPVRPLPHYQPGGEIDADREIVDKQISAGGLPETKILEVALEAWRDKASTEVAAFGGGLSVDEFDLEAAMSSPGVSVPGWYALDDRKYIERVLSTAGFADPTIYRAPVAVAAAELAGLQKGGIHLVIDMGHHWCDLGVIDINPESQQIQVCARMSIPGLGRRRLDETIARWALNRTIAEESFRLDNPDDITPVRNAAHRALDDLTARGSDETAVRATNVPIRLENKSTEVEVNQPLDVPESLTVLKDPIGHLLNHLEKLMAVANFESTDLNGMLIAGSGTVPYAVRWALEGAFELAARLPTLGTYKTAPALGAAVLAVISSGEATPIGTDTPHWNLGVRIPVDEGFDVEQLASAIAAHSDRRTVILRTTVDNQTRGRVDVVAQHPLTGAVHEREYVVIRNIPPTSTGERLVAFTCLDVEKRELEARLVTDSEGNAIDRSLDVSFVDDASDVPWLCRKGDEVDDDRARPAETPSFAQPLDPVEEALSDVSPSAVVERVYELRHDLWRAMKEGHSLSTTDIEAHIRKFDTGLKRFGVTPIVPETGVKQDPKRHRALEIRESELPEENIIEVFQPGIQAGDRIIDPAKVAVSTGRPDGPDKQSED
jgi:molecular chaperone DnaK (HSP70)